ncbi:MAG: methylated-DNA--[protein]-cysteine S-methyltransferase [Calditrichia bacterium]
MKAQVYHSEIDSPLGRLSVFATEKGVVRLTWKEAAGDLLLENITKNSTLHWNSGNEPTRLACRQLELYFNGYLREFDVPLDLEGTAFQLRVWEQLCRIPFGTAISYQQLAEAVDNPQAMRAVGNANGRNPVPILVPCHRVIQKDGSIGGYSGGIHIKKWLLNHEGLQF